MEVIPVGTSSLQYEGTFDDAAFYNFSKDTFQNAGYSVKESRHIQFAGPNYHIEWFATKAIDDYMAYRIKVILDFRNVTETSVIKDGKPAKVKTGTVQVELSSDMLLDYLDKWTTGISKLIRPIYDKMNAQVLEQRKNTFEQDIQNIKATLQAHFS